MRRVAILGTASGCGKTTVGRTLAGRLGVRFVELDSLHHGPGWNEATAEELRAKVAPIVAEDAWVIDGGYQGKLGDMVLERADTVVWLDLPTRVWLRRLLRRTAVRIARREELWNGNRETLRNVVFSRDSLVLFALRTAPRRRGEYPERLARFNLVRLRSQWEVDGWLAGATRS